MDNEPHQVVFRDVAAVAPLFASGAGSRRERAPKKEFSIAWSIYVGWMPWPYAQQAGIVKKWADKYGIKINVVQINDYVESINQYTAGKFDGVTVTNMDALTIPARAASTRRRLSSATSPTAMTASSSRTGKSVADLKGKKINLVELSVSHYLLARALQSAKLTEKAITVVNTSDADMVAAFKAKDVVACVTWNPLLAEVQAEPGATLVYDFEQNPRRNHRHAGREHRRAERQS